MKATASSATVILCIVIASRLFAGHSALAAGCPTPSFAEAGALNLAAPRAIAVGDFNGDGKLDLAVANAGAESGSVVLGNGDGSFQPAVLYGVGGFAEAVAVADFNSDGKPDLALASGSA